MVYLTERAGRQGTHRNRYQHSQRQQSEQKHRLPSEPRYDGYGQQCRDRSADRHAGHHHRRDRAAPFRCNQFRRKRIRRRNQAAQADACDKPQRPERHRPGGQRAQRGEHRQHHRTSDDRALAADRVGEPAREHRADHHPDERQAAQRARRGGADPPLPLQAGNHVAVDDQVVAVEDHEQPADEDGDQRRAAPLGGQRCASNHGSKVIAATSRLQYSSAVRNKPQKAIQKPAYLLESVDNALRLLQMLRDVGAVRLNQAATELGIARSTAHRLLAMLVYRGFAVQDEKRTYHPGPAMGAGPAERGWTREFTDRCRPHLEALAAVCGETVNLVIRTGTQVGSWQPSSRMRCCASATARARSYPPTHSGGRSLLAELPDDVLQRLYLKTPGDDELDATDRRLDPAEFDEFRRELNGVRRAGFAVNVEQTEEGVAAFGMSVHNHAGRPIGAISVSVPAVRYQRHAHGQLVAQMKRAVREMELDVADIEP